MRDFIATYKNNRKLHHAYIIEGRKESARRHLFKFLEDEVGISTKANPDFYYRDFENFGIDNGRELKEMATRQAVFGGLKIFSFSFNAITREAQNSLLKLFEEPPSNTLFFAIVPKAHVLLPTLLSRMFIVSLGGAERDDDFEKRFLESDTAERLSILKNIIDEKNRSGTLDVLNKIERALYKNADLKNAEKKAIFLFEEIRVLRRYVNTRSPSVKMILEHISLITPVIE
jgi:hypothetical protein